MSDAEQELMSGEELREEIRAIGARRYHSRHPFHRKLHGGELDRGQVQAWALNRYCYQSAIPRKDAALISRVHDKELRREWRRRIRDHDGELGEGETSGGIERWLALTSALGLERDRVVAQRGVLAATTFAVEAYVRFVREKTLLEAVASSLTELFAPQIIAERVEGMIRTYEFIDNEALKYFEYRLDEAPRDSNFALDYVVEHARRPDQQQAVLDALRFKCDVLWAQLDALYHAYVEPGHIPPGGFEPKGAGERR